MSRDEDSLVTYLIGAMGFSVCAGTGLEKVTLAALTADERVFIEELNSLSLSASKTFQSSAMIYLLGARLNCS